MKLTTSDNVGDLFIKSLDKVYITFDNKEEVILKNITDWDIDLDPVDYSIIGFTNAFQNNGLIRHFNKRESIKFIHIEGKGIKVDDCKDVDLFYDIQCNMKIRKLRINGSRMASDEMFVEFEGVVV